MLDPFEMAIYTCQIVAFQIIASPALSLFGYKQALAKNKEWVLQNQGVLQRHPAPNPWWPRIFGIVFLLLVAGSLLAVEPAHLLKAAHYGSVLVFIVQHLGVDYLRQRRLKAEIPPIQIRSASLTLRTLAEFIPKPLYLGFFAAMIGSVVGMLHQPQSMIWGTLAVYAVCLVGIAYSVRRKPIVADDEAAIFYRRSEVYVLFFVFVAFVIDSYLRLIGTTLGLEFLTARIVDYTFTLIPIGIFLWFGTNKTFRRLMNESFVTTQAS